MRFTRTMAALALAGPWVAQAQTQEALYVRSLAANCASCHGTNGHAVPGAGMPGIAGRPRAELVAQLQAFKAGSRPATVMHQLAKGYSDAQIELIAGYLAQQKP